jgi:excisionase family DNA binding protein
MQTDITHSGCMPVVSPDPGHAPVPIGDRQPQLGCGLGGSSPDASRGFGGAGNRVIGRARPNDPRRNSSRFRGREETAMLQHVTRRQFESLAQASARTGLSIRTLRRRISDGTLNAYRSGPRVIRLDLEDVDRLMTRIPTAS